MLVTPCLAQKTTVPLGSAKVFNAFCHYSTGAADDCTHKDINGYQATWNTNNPTVYTVDANGVGHALALGTANVIATAAISTGTLTSNAITMAVVPALVSVALSVTSSVTPTQAGVTVENVVQNQSAGFINSTYYVPTAAATATACNFYLAAGPQTAGKQWMCGVILAPTPTTQATSWLCSGTLVNVTSTAPNSIVSVPLTNCNLPATPYWIAVETNDTAVPKQGFNNCGNSCGGAPPISGSGTYPYKYAANAFGNTTGMTTTLLSGSPTQMTAYLTLAVASNPTATLLRGSSAGISAACTYSDGSTTNCNTPDVNGNGVTFWGIAGSSTAPIASMTSAGVITGIAAGTTNVIALIGLNQSASLPITIQ